MVEYPQEIHYWYLHECDWKLTSEEPGVWILQAANKNKIVTKWEIDCILNQLSFM